MATASPAWAADIIEANTASPAALHVFLCARIAARWHVASQYRTPRQREHSWPAPAAPHEPQWSSTSTSKAEGLKGAAGSNADAAADAAADADAAAAKALHSFLWRDSQPAR